MAIQKAKNMIMFARKQVSPLESLFKQQSRRHRYLRKTENNEMSMATMLRTVIVKEKI